ncbi:hypothetical protein [Streptomyces sp. NBC_01497]|nr:hypothetical protein [Streptomyces sp. NBC_01497]
MIYNFRVRRGSKGESKDFAWQDYRGLIVRAHKQFGGPVVPV